MTIGNYAVVYFTGVHKFSKNLGATSRP